MTEFFAEYGLFLAKTLTFVVAVILIMGAVVANAQKAKKMEKGSLTISHLNKELDSLRTEIKRVVLDREVFKLEAKAERRLRKLEAKARRAGNADDGDKRRVYVIDFEGDIKATEVENMRRAITSVLSVARPGVDEVLLRLESTGGMVHAYGLAASQLQRIRKQGIALTISVDKVAASGGYMMACLGDRILAAPFAILGSVGVLMQMPNFYRLLQDNKVDYEMITAGEYKRTLTMFGENTERGRAKMKQDIEEAHTLFKDFIREARPGLDVDQIATGETWFGTRALELKLIDELMTSDEYMIAAAEQADVFSVVYKHKKNLSEKLGSLMENSAANAVGNWIQKASRLKYFS